MQANTRKAWEVNLLLSLQVNSSSSPKSEALSSVIIIVVLGHKDVVLLQQRCKVLADQSSQIQEGHHYQSNPDKAEGGLFWFGKNGSG